MHFGHGNEHRQYNMRNEDTEVVMDTCMEEKDLGVWTDDNLEFTEPIGRICIKVNQTRTYIQHLSDHSWNMQMLSGPQGSKKTFSV